MTGLGLGLLEFLNSELSGNNISKTYTSTKEILLFNKIMPGYTILILICKNNSKII